MVIVDDDPDLLAAYARVLTRAGHDTVACPDGESALAQVRKDPPDLLLTDVAMPPGMSGLELVTEIAADPAVADIPVILVTGGWVDLDGAEPPRVARLLRKPVAPPDLVTTVETVLADRLRHHVRLPTG
ncbi:response regulator [Planosporangium mesophilum]|uniref:response regulator n=1 Tax=Planosporangium mesophilum TaxID=689768 RepID=UPI001439BF1D|nr:response regulator [Planosporangium mesophilum]NJC83140.1 response regulator [Planosporangium mesophilum]